MFYHPYKFKIFQGTWMMPKCKRSPIAILNLQPSIKLFHIATLLCDYQYVLLKLVHIFHCSNPLFLNFHHCYKLFSHQNLAQVQFCLSKAFGVFMFQFILYSHDLFALLQGHYFVFQNLLVWVLISNVHDFLRLQDFLHICKFEFNYFSLCL